MILSNDRSFWATKTVLCCSLRAFNFQFSLVTHSLARLDHHIIYFGKAKNCKFWKRLPEVRFLVPQNSNNLITSRSQNHMTDNKRVQYVCSKGWCKECKLYANGEENNPIWICNFGCTDVDSLLYSGRIYSTQLCSKIGLRSKLDSYDNGEENSATWISYSL